MAVKTSTAPELTAEQVVRVLVQPLEESSKFLASSPRIFDTTGPLRVPKMGGMVDDQGDPDTPDWIGESELITTKDVDFREVTLLPSTMKSIKTITRYSNEMARASIVALDAVLQQRLVTDVAAELDRQLFSATGDGVTTPRGLLAYEGVQEADIAGADVTLDDLTDAWGMCLSADVNMAGLRWIMRPETFIKLRKVKEATGSNRPVLQPDVTQDSLFRLFGSQVTVTKRLPLDAEGQASVVLADMSQVAVARDLAPSVTVLRERFADYDEQALRVVCRYDAKPLNPEAIVVLRNAARGRCRPPPRWPRSSAGNPTRSPWRPWPRTWRRSRRSPGPTPVASASPRRPRDSTARRTSRRPSCRPPPARCRTRARPPAWRSAATTRCPRCSPGST